MPGSGNVLIDAIAGIGWLGRGGNNNITYYFNNSLGFHNWTATEKAAYQAALQQFANVANITIQEVFSPVGADMNENWVSNADILANFGDFGGYHQYPFNPGPATGYYNFDGRPYFNAAGLTPGGVGFQLLMHEVGHGMGLAHPHDTDMGTGVLPGVVNSSDLGTLSYNQNLYSIMSYNNGPSLSSGSNNYGHAATLMAFDIAAIQYLYGANNNFHGSGDTYTLPDTNSPGTYWSCIWDTGGIDQIVYGGTRNATIDLRAATIDNSPTGGGIPSLASGIFGGFTIANGVVIENASGGSGADTLTGNNVANFLAGNGGYDVAVGGFGNDTLVGAFGADTLLGNQDNDVILGNQDNDIVVGGQGADVVVGGQGFDFVFGNEANDFVFGNESNDTIIAGQGADTVFAGQGDDSILGSEGNDSMFGNEGADHFTFATGSGADIIGDFNGAAGDRLTLFGQTYVQGTSGDGDVLLTLSGGGTIELNGIAPAGFQPGFLV